MTKTFLLDLGERALKTFIQAALAVVLVQFAGSGLGANIFDGSAWQKIGTAAVAAGVAAVVSLVTSSVSGLKTGTASASAEVAQTAVSPAAGSLYVSKSGEVIPVEHTPEHAADADEPNVPHV